MLALSFAWFSQPVNTKTTTVLKAGTYVKVVFSDDNGSLVNEKYNGQKGYDENGVAYTDDDAAYEAYYHTALKLQGSADLYLRFEFTELLIKVSDTYYRADAETTVDEVISLFDGYDAQKSHIGKVETVSGADGDEEIFTDPADGSEAFIYTSDGTVDGDVRYIRLNKANTDKFFEMSYARITDDNPPYVYGTFVGESETLRYVYDDNQIQGASEVSEDYMYGKLNVVCIKITYSDATYARTFPFSGEDFKAAVFGFGVVASANYS